MCFFSVRLTGRTIENVINMGSYNYLGFAENNVDFLKTVAEKTRQYGVGVCSTRQELGICVVTPQPKHTYNHRNRSPIASNIVCFKNRHGSLFSNYCGLVNATINLSKAFFPLVIWHALSSIHRIPSSPIDLLKAQPVFEFAA